MVELELFEHVEYKERFTVPLSLEADIVLNRRHPLEPVSDITVTVLNGGLVQGRSCFSVIRSVMVDNPGPHVLLFTKQTLY